MNKYISIFKQNRPTLIWLYACILLGAVYQAISPIVLSYTIGNLPYPPILLLLYTMFSWGIINYTQYITDVTRTNLRSLLWQQSCVTELERKTPVSSMVTKLKGSNAIVDVMIGDIPSIIEVISGLLTITITSYALNYWVGCIMVISILITATITVIKTNAITSLYSRLYELDAKEVDMLSGGKIEQIVQWNNERMDHVNKFWIIDLLQGITQSPVIIGAAWCSLMLVEYNATNLTMILGLYITLFHNVNMFAKLQEGIGKAMVASKLLD